MTKKTDKKAKKAKLVRDSFTMPADEYLAFDRIKAQALQAGKSVKKTEILRAGLVLLGRCTTADLLAALNLVPSLKAGRPASDAAPKAPKKSAELLAVAKKASPAQSRGQAAARGNSDKAQPAPKVPTRRKPAAAPTSQPTPRPTRKRAAPASPKTATAKPPATRQRAAKPAAVQTLATPPKA